MKIILYQPQIPQNTGNIVRTSAATGVDLILVPPLGFSTSSRQLKRAGLDYWDGVNVQEVEDLFSYLEGKEPLFFSSKARKIYTDAPFSPNCCLIFGSETAGLPQEFWAKYPDRFYKIPMLEGKRCLNLATSAAIVLYEALRQTGFSTLDQKES